MNTAANVWRFRMKDGNVVYLVSDLARDRMWMEQEKPEGFTPWMHMGNEPPEDLSVIPKKYTNLPKVGGLIIWGRGRVDMSSVASISHWREILEGELPDGVYPKEA